MKKYILCLFAFLALAGCSDDNDNMPTVKPSASGTFTDERDGTTYAWARYGSLEWTTTNLAYVPASGTFRPTLTPDGAYDDPWNHEFYDKFGGLYDYTAAVASVLDGWRIPSDEDWQNLEKLFGMSDADLGSKGARGKHAGDLMKQGDTGTGFALGLAGCYVNDGYYSGFYDGEAVGYYWSSTLDPEKDNGLSRLYRMVIFNNGKVTRESTGGPSLFSVRLVRDAS